MTVKVEIEIAESFGCHIDAAVTRLRYLHPNWTISTSPTMVYVTVASTIEEIAVRRDVNYALYRERIRSESAPLRELLLKSVMT